MSNFLKAIGAFLAFFCLILGLEIVFGKEDPSVLFGALFAALGATFFFMFFFKK